MRFAADETFDGDARSAPPHSELLADLRRLGVRLSLDDFGTGYSSLTHLSELPIQQLKIDRSFVMAVHDSPRDRAIITAVAGLARNLDLEVIAEGIEKPETASLLADIGCAYGQGHFFAMSMSPELLPMWVATREQSWTPPPLAVAGGPARAELLRTVR